MAVDVAEDVQEFPGSEESDEEYEVSFRQSQSSSSAMEEDEVLSIEGHDPNALESSQVVQSGKRDLVGMTNQERRNKIKEIDIDMKVKLQELKALMSGGGFEGSEVAAIADDILTADEGQNIRKFSNNKSVKRININASNSVNVRNKEIQHTFSESEATIYKNAIEFANPLKDSNDSASDGEMEIEVDSSNELVEVNQIIRSIAGNSNAGQDTETEEEDVMTEMTRVKRPTPEEKQKN